VAIGIVLAGRPNTRALRAAAPDCPWEALIPIAGRPMTAYVVEALAAVKDVQRVIVAGPPELRVPGAVVVAPGAGVVSSWRAALAAAGDGDDAQELLVSAGDAPLLRAETLERFLQSCRTRGLALGYPIVERSVCQQGFPGVRRTYVRLANGSFTGGNCAYVHRTAVEPCLELLDRVHRDRKHPLRLARLFGWGPLLALAFGRLRLETAEAAAGALLGVRAAAWISPDAGIGVDVDDADDLALCRAALGTPAPGRG
jgi:CTP:molybdopterin cytidylyltransferase MocA